jgi:hypothetical protein
MLGNNQLSPRTADFIHELEAPCLELTGGDGATTGWSHVFLQYDYSHFNMTIN